MAKPNYILISSFEGGGFVEHRPAGLHFSSRLSVPQLRHFQLQNCTGALKGDCVRGDGGDWLGLAGK